MESYSNATFELLRNTTKNDMPSYYIFNITLMNPDAEDNFRIDFPKFITEGELIGMHCEFEYEEMVLIMFEKSM